MNEVPPQIPRKFNTNEDPNFFWIEIPGTSLRINISVLKIQQEGLDYLDEIANEIENYYLASFDKEFNIPMIRIEIPSKTLIYGEGVLYFYKIPNQPPQVMLGDKDNHHIKKLDEIYNSIQSKG